MNTCHALIIVLVAMIAAINSDGAAAVSEKPLPAFPGAVGWGAETPGGRGGRVLLVTNLNDSGRGSLREAVETEGPRIILFRVAGTIELKREIKITHPFITISGETAPGGGVCLKNHALEMSGTHDVILRHLRVRPGDVTGREMDAISGRDVKNIIIANCSASWSIDETLSITGDSDLVTVQGCLIAESLNNSVHKKGKHGYGSLLVAQDGRFTFFNNVYAHHNSRNPRPGAKEGTPGLQLDFRNNLIYNWGDRAGYSSLTPVRMNYVGNHLKRGPSTAPNRKGEAFHVGGPLTHIFMEGNHMEGFEAENADNWRMVTFEEAMTPEEKAQVRAGKPFEFKIEKTLTAPGYADGLLHFAGAILPTRDAVDERIVQSIREGKGRIIDSQNEVGGWAKLAEGTAPPDEDFDGMADAWEQSFGFSTVDASNATQDPDGDGYTNIEEFMYGMNPLAGR